MIIQLVVFISMVGVGTAAWFYFQLILEYVINFMATEFPQWFFDTVFIDFFVGVVQWGLLLLCWMPAAIYLWTNTQRPEIRR